MNICVVGSGYVGLVTGACLADFGMHVVCVDKDEAKVEALRGGVIPIYEPGLGTLVKKNASEKRLTFTTDLERAVEDAVVVFVAVGTPSLSDGSTDLSYVREVARSIAQHLNGFKVVVNKSTVPIGTGRLVEEILHSRAPEGTSFAVVSNPEFLREGSAIEDFLRPDRLVIGSRDPRATEIMLDIYSPLRLADVPFVITDVETAELIKYASNSFLATKISFINEVAHLCESLGADVEVVARGMGLDDRIGSRFLHPGPGFGGSCFPKDTRALVHIARQCGTPFRIVEAVLEVNEATKARMFDKIREAFGEPLGGLTVGVLGLSFKPDTDDIRESPALPIVERLLGDGARVRVYDPAAMEPAKPELEGAYFASDSYEAANGVDGLVILTEWNQFRHLDLSRLRAAMRRPLIVDLRNIYEPAKMAQAGFHYVSIGRAAAAPAHV
jgi:UDPglucose 6-dehydrogenase